jgi:hypothetical protein
LDLLVNIGAFRTGPILPVALTNPINNKHY